MVLSGRVVVDWLPRSLHRATANNTVAPVGMTVLPEVEVIIVGEGTERAE